MSRSQPWKPSTVRTSTAQPARVPGRGGSRRDSSRSMSRTWESGYSGKGRCLRILGQEWLRAGAGWRRMRGGKGTGRTGRTCAEYGVMTPIPEGGSPALTIAQTSSAASLASRALEMDPPSSAASRLSSPATETNATGAAAAGHAKPTGRCRAVPLTPDASLPSGCTPVADRRSKSVTASPPRAAPAETTVGGSWQGSPTRNSCSQPSRAPMRLEGSTAWEASSRSTLPKCARTEGTPSSPAAGGESISGSLPAPMHVLTTTGAPSSSRRAAAASTLCRAANAAATRAPLRASCAAFSAPRASDTAGSLANIASTVHSRHASATHPAGPSRTAHTPRSRNPDSSSSAATLDAATASTPTPDPTRTAAGGPPPRRLPVPPPPAPPPPPPRPARRSAEHAASRWQAVRVLPVPGGPWMSTSRRCSAVVIAPTCDGLSAGLADAAATAATAALTWARPAAASR
eukprot:scaffold6769_cov114-Isochrysis_galbana.AAC.2